MPPRFHAPALDREAATLLLAGDEAQHLTRVLRLGEGAAVCVFNGRGLEREAVVEALSRGAAVLRLGAEVEAARELPFALTLVQAVLKGDAFDAVVRDATMLGVAAVQPIVTARTEVPRPMLVKGGRRERWARVAVSSAKQCRRAVVPDVHDPIAFEDAVRLLRDRLLVVLTEPSSPVEPGSPADLPTPSAAAAVFVGPEGGWTKEELSAARADGARFVTLGDRTLRAETAAVVALPVLLWEWNAL